MSNPEFSFSSGMMREAGAQSPIAVSREETLRRFFIGRLEYLIALRDGLGDSLEIRDVLLIKRALYSTYRDCVSLGVGDEARTRLGSR